jgi:hypothetical protein
LQSRSVFMRSAIVRLKRVMWRALNTESYKDET